MRQLTLPELRAEIEAALAAFEIPLGTYRHKNGSTGPALSVGDPAEGVTVEGLEVLIPATPDFETITVFSGTVSIAQYPVRAVSHDGRSLSPVWNALSQTFRGVSAPQVLQATERYPDQIVISITP